MLKIEIMRVQTNKFMVLGTPCGVMQNAWGKIKIKKSGKFISVRRICIEMCDPKNWIWVNSSPLSATNAATAMRHWATVTLRFCYGYAHKSFFNSY